MKQIAKSWLFKACNLCIVFGGFLHWTKMSLLLFGELKYPEEPKEK